MKASGSPFGVKIDEKKEHHPIYHLGKMYDAMMLFKPASNKHYKDSHQFSCKIQVTRFYLSSPLISRQLVGNFINIAISLA
jgi:hypothetical protein